MKTAFAAAVLVLATALPAHATEVTQFAWDRTGESNLPCAGAVDWLLSPGDGIDDATVGINDDDGVPDGHAWTMLKNWDTGEFYITTTEPVVASDEVLVAFVGTGTPVLSLVGCEGVEASSAPPVVPPSSGGSAPVPAPPTTQSQVQWQIGFTVHTIRPTNVLAKWRVVCSDGQVSVASTGKTIARTPLVRHLQPSFPEATYCHIRVRAYDIPPHVRPHNWPAPVVEAWAEAV